MTSNFLKIQLWYLQELYADLPPDLESMLPAQREGNTFQLKAFGELYSITRHGIYLKGQLISNPLGILIALYASKASAERVRLKPFKAFKQFKDSAPYHVAFKARSEESLVPHVTSINDFKNTIREILEGRHDEEERGDFSFVLYPLPKIALCYIFYLADEEFPASVTCLFSANAEIFMPVDGLADVAEYTSREIIEIVTR